MWTSKNRGRYDHSKLRYPSDLTDDEWRLIEPLIPPGRRGGGKRTVIMREVMNGLMYVSQLAVSGARSRKTCRRKAQSTTISICGPMTAHWGGSTTRPYEQCREQAEREASPTAAIIDSQRVKSAEKGGSALICTVTMQARRSRARSGTFSSIH